MSLKFNPIFFALTITLLVTEISIAYFLNSGFIRFTLGDFLSSILVYCAIKTIFKTSTITVAIIALIISFSIEFAQLANLLDYLDLRHNTLTSIILGSHFSVQDLIAYALGIITIYFVDINYITTHENY
ncbi:DUF2809 domain-containing protein [Olleya sp. ITB9]|uniref:ribosomal maturation YjgA family protein n=1 Tax=Olleya sp. ITB9 TaxID=1715648 RepID=UPI0006D16C06|nr:DUF2809 domain-containing protein [Olleya sp. ITB9]